MSWNYQEKWSQKGDSERLEKVEVIADENNKILKEFSFEFSK